MPHRQQPRQGRKTRVLRQLERFKAQFSEAEWETLTEDGPPEPPRPAPGPVQAVLTATGMRLVWPDGQLLDGSMPPEMLADLRRRLEAGEHVHIQLGYAPIMGMGLGRSTPAPEAGGYLLPAAPIRRMLRQLVRELPRPLAPAARVTRRGTQEERP